MIMKLKDFHKEDLIHKPTIRTARTLHKLYESNKVHVPSIKELIIKRISICKYFDDNVYCEYDKDDLQEDFELCNLIGIDYDDIDPIDFPQKHLD